MSLPADYLDRDPVSMAEEAARQLVGTCKSLADLGEDFEDWEDNPLFCKRLDELVFCCEGCNWWFEQADMASEWRCEDCSEDGAE